MGWVGGTGVVGCLECTSCMQVSLRRGGGEGRRGFFILTAQFGSNEGENQTGTFDGHEPSLLLYKLKYEFNNNTEKPREQNTPFELNGYIFSSNPRAVNGDGRKVI